MSIHLIKNELRHSIPPNSQIHFVDITYDPSCEWVDVLRGTDTRKQNYREVIKIGSQFPPGEQKNINETIALIRYFRLSAMCDARDWALSHGLQETTPREVFAIGKQYPNINTDLGQELTCVVATKTCIFLGYTGACYFWRTCDELRMGVGLLPVFSTDEHWFSFVIPSSIV